MHSCIASFSSYTAQHSAPDGLSMATDPAGRNSCSRRDLTVTERGEIRSPIPDPKGRSRVSSGRIAVAAMASIDEVPGPGVRA